MAKLNFSRGSIEQMIDAFQNKIVELGGNYTPDIDDVVQSADAITAAYRDDIIEDDPYVEFESGDIEEGSYVDVLISDVNVQLEEVDHFDSWTWEYTDSGETLVLTTVLGETVEEYEIPLSDLSNNIESVSTDVNYIVKTVLGEDVEACDFIQSDTEIEDESNDEEMEEFMHFGLKQAKQYGDMICEKLSGKTISKNRMLANKPGGLIYEADNLGIDKWDLLEALEGMCYQGRAQEIDDSTYKVLGNCSNHSKVNSNTEVEILPGDEEIIYSDPDYMFGDGSDISLADIKDYWNNNNTGDPTLSQYSTFDEWWKATERWLTVDGSCDMNAGDEELDTVTADGEYSKWEEVRSKQVPDTDGFFTDYTLYFNPFTGEYICMFGDKDLYSPDFDYADWSGDNEQEALEWFNDYDGFVEQEHEFDPDDYYEDELM